MYGKIVLEHVQWIDEIEVKDLFHEMTDDLI